MFSPRQKMWIARQANRGLRLARALLLRGPQVECVRRGVRWRLDLDEGIDLSIYLLGAYEPSVLKAYAPLVGPGAVVFDIGANIGAHTLHFARLAGPTGRVYAFEPTAYAYAKLQAHLEVNPALAPGITALQAFLTDHSDAPVPGQVYASWPVHGPGGDRTSGHDGAPESTAGAAALTADGFCAERGINRLDLVKLDVDGNEWTVLAGFRASLARFRPTVLIELAPFVHRGEGADHFDRVLRLFSELGYAFCNARTGHPIPRDPAAVRALIPPGHGINALLKPPSARRPDVEQRGVELPVSGH
jgi:FkbM family methyltransferase